MLSEWGKLNSVEKLRFQIPSTPPNDLSRVQPKLFDAVQLLIGQTKYTLKHFLCHFKGGLFSGVRWV